jgi:glycosyltransferase involved in cell wall biosynthesis
VIYNPVDTALFKPHYENTPTSSRAKIVYISFSTNIKKGADQIFQVAQENQDIDFILIGRFNNQPEFKNLRFTGHLNREEVAGILSTCHFFLFFSQNEACPNVILEAMASGLPVLYLDSGGTAELVGNTGIAITTETFREAFEKIWHDWHDWSKTARTRAEDTFSVNKIIPEYLTAISNLKKQ